LDPLERELVAARVAAGERFDEIAAAFGCSWRTVFRVRDEMWLRRRRVAHSRFRLSFVERERISRGVAAGESVRAIARELGRAPSTVSREIARCGGRQRYRALGAERLAQQRAGRPKPTKLQGSERLLAEVEAGLRKRFSPQQISARLRLAYPDDPEMRISHETIYQSLYVQSRGELRRQLAKNLRSGRSRRKPRAGGPERRGRIRDMVPIAQRPPEVDERRIPGHWEADLLLGAYGRSQIATLVERHTRYVMLAKLPDRSTEHVIDALKQRIKQLPEHLTLSLTCDQGREFAAHERLTIQTGIDVYFCDPHSPWQRGTGENTNGLLRQYLPKNSDLSTHSQTELDHIAAELNQRPRQTLDWFTPAERMTELLR
jgi:IS30 family transposase